MKEMKTLPLAFTYVGCFLGAGFVSGQELWQFFGSFGVWGYVGLAVTTLLFVFFGILLIRLAQLTGSNEMDYLIVPWNLPWLRKMTSIIGWLFLLGVVIIMVAGVAALLQQMFAIPYWLGAALFSVLVGAIALAGVSGMVKIFSALVPILVLATLAFAVISLNKYGTDQIFAHGNVNSNPLTPNWLIASLTYVAYNMLGAISIITPVGRSVKRKNAVYCGISLGGLMLAGVAGSILVSLAVYPAATEQELPMVALAEGLNLSLGMVYGILLLLGMFCNALASFVTMTDYLTIKGIATKVERRIQTLFFVIVAWLCSLFGFGDLVGTVFPVFGYISIVFLICMVVHFVQRCKGKKEFLKV